MTIGDRIRSAREEKGWTQQQLADKMGYKSNMSIWQYENDKYKPNSRTLMAFERVLGNLVK